MFCDVTIDAPSTLSEEEELEKKEQDEKFTEYAERLQELIDEVKAKLG